MHTRLLTKAGLVLAGTLFSLSTLARDYSVGDLMIDQPVARATPPGAQAAAGYLTIHNKGAEDDRLIGASAEFARRTEVHEMRMDGEMMRMRELENGLPIPAGETVILESGGNHLMFMNIDQQLKPEQQFSGTLQFEKAGEVQITFNVVKIAGDKHKMKHGSHGETKHDHGHKKKHDHSSGS